MFARHRLSRIRLFVNLSHQIIQGPGCRFRSRVATAANNRNNRQGKLKRPNQVPDSLKEMFDGEAYYDQDFDYVDRRKEYYEKKMIRKFGGDETTSARAVLKSHTYRNALFEDDEDDLKLAAAKRESGKGKHLISNLHRQFENEVNRKQTFKSIDDIEQEQELDDEPEYNFEPRPISQRDKPKMPTNKAPRESHEKQIEPLRSTQMIKDVDKSKLRVKEMRIERKKAREIVPLPYDINEENRFEVLNDIVMPMHRMSYYNQIRHKHQQNMNMMKRFGEKLRLMDGPIRLNSVGLPCPVEHVRASPRNYEYRNKDEYTVWPGIDGNTKTVGFLVGQQSLHDRVICVEPDQMRISKQSHIQLAWKFQQYLREVSPYDYCQNYGDAGNWRRLHVRSNEAGDHMVTAVMHPQHLSMGQLHEEMDRLKAYFADDPLVKSLYFHAARNTRSTHTNEPYYHLAGDATISERLFDKTFVISPSSFFQVNTAAAEVLYRTVMTELSAKKRVTLLDLCCGTGTLSILMADQVKHVIGIDSSKSSIEDARRNAAANNISNVAFHHGTVEDILPQIAEQAAINRSPVVAVVNPSRRGLHPNLVRTLRKMDCIGTLVYVSCKPDGDAFNNFVHLCRPRESDASDAAFVPVNAVPVDLFPQTEHCELVLTFKRF